MRFRRITLLRAGLLLLGGGLVVVGLLAGYRALFGPHLDSLSPLVVDPGGTVTLTGRNFGAARADSRVEVDGVAPTASSYLSWTSGSIALKLPPGSESGLVYVVTHRGRSNAKLFLNRARLPVGAKGQGEGRSGPFISALSTERGAIGSRLVLSGLNFGANRETSGVYFSWNPEGGASVPDERADAAYLSPSEADLAYEAWSDKEIALRVPDGASSGSLYIQTAAGKSNAVYFAVTDLPGRKSYKDRRSYSIAYSVSLTKVRASGANDLYLWIPRPATSASQRISRILGQDPAPYVPDYRGTALYAFKNLLSGQDVTVSQSFLVQSWAVETQVDPGALPKTDSPPAVMAAYVQADDLLPVNAPEVQALARKILQGEKNPWKSARLIYDYLGRTLLWTAGPETRRVLPALQAGRADSTTYALAATTLLRAAGIPALPVLGYLVDSNRNTVRHAWLEFYIYGLGWVPMDPVLGSGASPGNLEVLYQDRSRYFGGIDNRRLAFSRGFSVLEPMSAGGRHASPQRPFSLQSFHEEASGSLEAYSSFWSEVEVSGLY